MDIIKIIGVGLVTCIAAVIVKNVRPEFSSIIALAGGTLILLMIIDYLETIFSTLNTIINATGLDSSFFKLILKIIGIGYLCEFASNLCVDAGQSSISDKILLAGKVVILFLSLPIIQNLIDIIVSILP